MSISLLFICCCMPGCLRSPAAAAASFSCNRCAARALRSSAQQHGHQHDSTTCRSTCYLHERYRNTCYLHERYPNMCYLHERYRNMCYLHERYIHGTRALGWADGGDVTVQG
jgi:hypothetical protein